MVLSRLRVTVWADLALVRVRGALHRFSGKYKLPAGITEVVGVEISGTIASCGADCTRNLAVGTRVAAVRCDSCGSLCRTRQRAVGHCSHSGLPFATACDWWRVRCVAYMQHPLPLAHESVNAVLGLVGLVNYMVR